MRRQLTLLAAIVLALATTFTVNVTTALPAHADACYTWDRVLKRGMSGSDVKILQSRIAGWMTYGTSLALDGQFGPATEGALKRFQSGYGLSADGIAGSQTYSKIYALQDDDCTPIHFSHSEFNYSCGERDYTG
ncbi:MAG: peptidoglycan-binding domain-containing protein, partial [Dehalococcoidia bacterium]